MYIIFELLDEQEQLLDILQSYFRHAATYKPDTADAGCTTYFSNVGMDFIFQSAYAASKLKPTSPPFSRHVNVLQSLASDLRDLHEDPEAGPSPDYLFFASFTYAYRLLSWDSDMIATETDRDLILAILQYRERVIPRKDLKPDSTTRTLMGGHLTTTGPALLIRPERVVLSSLPLRRSRQQISRHSNLLRFKNSTTHLVMQLLRFRMAIMHLSVPLQRRTMSRGQCTTSGLEAISTVEDIGKKSME